MKKHIHPIFIYLFFKIISASDKYGNYGKRVNFNSCLALGEPVLAAPVKEETTAKKRGAKSAKVIVDSCQIYLLMIVCCTELGMTVDCLCVCMRMCIFNL